MSFSIYTFSPTVIHISAETHTQHHFDDADHVDSIYSDESDSEIEMNIDNNGTVAEDDDSEMERITNSVKDNDEDNSESDDDDNQHTWVPGGFSSRSKLLTHKEAFEIIMEQSAPVLEKPPTLPLRNSTGSCIFLVRLDEGKDWCFDALSPWYRKGKPVVAPKFGKILVDDNGNTVNNGEAAFHVRYCRGRHPIYTDCTRIIYRLTETDNKKSANSNILYQYKFNASISIADQGIKYKHLEPSKIKQLRKDLNNRKTQDVYNMRRNDGLTKLQVQNASRAVTTVIKERTGPRLITDLSEVTKLCLKTPHMQLFTETEDDGSVAINITNIFKESVEIFLSTCPTKDMLMEHHKYITELSNMKSEEAKRHINMLARSSDESGHLPNLGSGLAADTTFQISHLYLTLLQGFLPTFRHLSGKSSSLLLGYCLHTKRSSPHHKKLGEAFAKVAKEVNPSKRIPFFCTDGENSLIHIMEGDVFELTQYLQCDVHLRGNLKTALKSNALKDLSTTIFGDKELSSDGKTVYHPGILGQINRAKFDNKIDQLKVEDGTRILYKWMSKRRETLWKHHGLLAKMRGGLILQYCSTNLLENRNGRLKKICEKQLAAEQCISRLLRVHEEEMRNLIEATIGIHTNVVPSNAYSKMIVSQHDWNLKSYNQKINHLKNFGIQSALRKPSLMNSTLPAHFYRGKDADEIGIWMESIEGMICTKVETTENQHEICYYVHQSDAKEIAKVTIDEQDRINCSLYICSKKKDVKTVPCNHCIRVILAMDDSAKKNQLMKFEQKEIEESAKEVLRRQTNISDGKKMNRKFGFISRTNHSRAIHNLSLTDDEYNGNSTLDNTSYNDHSDLSVPVHLATKNIKTPLLDDNSIISLPRSTRMADETSSISRLSSSPMTFEQRMTELLRKTKEQDDRNAKLYDAKVESWRNVDNGVLLCRRNPSTPELESSTTERSFYENNNMFRMQQGPPAPPPLQSRFAIVNTIYNDPFNWGVFKGIIGFAVGVVVARTVSDEWVNAV